MQLGCATQVATLRYNLLSKAVSAGNKKIWGDFIDLVNRHFAPLGLCLCKQTGCKDVNLLLSWKDNFVIIASLRGSDASDGQHAIAICNGGIFYANYNRALTKTQESLDWCCGGGGIKCLGVHKLYVMLPKYYKDRPVEGRPLFQVKKSTEMVKGWTCGRFDSDTPKIQFADSQKRVAKKGELESLISLMD
jgi:hypothetical protein